MGLFPKNLNEYAASLGIPRGPKSKVYLVDPVNGDDDNSGTSWQKPLASLEAAEDLCVANQHDTVLFLAGASADNPTALITWDKSYTHLVGLGSELPGMGQRNRVVATAATALANMILFSGNGCIVKNMQFGNEYATGAVTVATVTGQRCLFENVFFMVPFSVTAASCSLKISGGENTFRDCTFGQHTMVRTGTSRNVWFYKGAGDNQRNKFIHCEFLSWSSATTHVLAYTDVDINNEAFTVQFDNCLWDNLNGSGEAGGVLAVAIDDNCAVHHQILLRGLNQFAGCTAVADPLTYVLTAEIGTGTQSGLLMATVNEA
jgi:hypothetical protein